MRRRGFDTGGAFANARRGIMQQRQQSRSLAASNDPAVEGVSPQEPRPTTEAVQAAFKKLLRETHDILNLEQGDYLCIGEYQNIKTSLHVGRYESQAVLIVEGNPPEALNEIQFKRFNQFAKGVREQGQTQGNDPMDEEDDVSNLVGTFHQNLGETDNPEDAILNELLV